MSEWTDIESWPRAKMYEVEEVDDRRAVIRVAVNCDGACTEEVWNHWLEVVETHEVVAIDFRANRYVLSRWLRLVNTCSISSEKLGATLAVVGMAEGGLEKADELQLSGLPHMKTLEEIWES